MKTFSRLPLRNLFYPAKNSSSFLLIIMHGLGDQMESYQDFPSLLLPDQIHTILLNAPDPYFMGWKWYDIDGDQEIGLKKSRALIEESLEILQEELSISKEKVFLSGFSQGGVVSLYTGLRSTHPFGGLICLSGYLFGDARDFTRESRKSPIFMAHGTYDELIPVDLSKRNAKHLQTIGYEVQWEEYPISHSIDIKEINSLRTWLEKRIQNIS